MVCKYVQNEISELQREQNVLRLCLPVCLVNCEALPYLQHLGILTFGPVHEASVIGKSVYLQGRKGLLFILLDT